MISIYTICYEGDWEDILKGGRLEQIILGNQYTFSERNLIINNVNNKEEVEHFAKIAVKNKVIDNYFFSEDYADTVLSEFSIERNSFKMDFY